MNQVDNIYYFKDIKDPSKPTIVFLHGLSSNHLTWEKTAKKFSDQGFNTLLLDLRGHGHSDKTRKRSLYHIPVMTKDLERIIEKENLTNFFLVGYSYGAYVAMDYATTHSDTLKGLVLVSPNHVSPFKYHWSAFINPVVYGLTNLIGWLFIWQKRKKYYYFNPERIKGYWRTTFSGYATMPLSINFWMLSEVFALDYREKIEHIHCPTLLVRGKNDAFVSAQETQDISNKIKHSEIATIDSGHYVASKEQDQTAERIEQFIKAHV
jgi:pimeloyl-ACP methyl ester carboxylesterase